jgi:hypothetical protein
VDRAKNEEANALAKAAARGEALPSDVFYHVIGTPAVRNPEGLQITNDSEGHRIVNLIMTEDWRAPITLFLQGYYHPTDINEAKRLKHQSRNFALIEGQLYKKGVSQPMLKCVTETEGVQILREVHSGTCGSHAGPRALAAKVICQGFYWPAMICAGNRVTRSCEACQKFSPRSGSPSQFTKLITHTWPLQRWGLDIIGPLPTAQGNLKFTFVVVEYFTKWIEARAVSTITSKTTQKFFWQNIVCRFGVPSELTVDNGKQFDSQDFKDFCFSIGTKLAFASVYHPQSNGVVERANGKIFIAVKKMILDDKKGKWADLLPEAVWALNTTECRVTRFTPFRLLYGSEAMTPQEIKHGSPRTVTTAIPDVDEPTSKDLIDGDHVFALQALNKYQAQTKAWRDHTVIPREFNEGDLVLVRTARTEARGKLEPKWEGLFIVNMKASPSVYRLATPSGEDLEHSWNINNLRKFLFDSSRPARPCNSQNSFIPARTLFLPGGEVFNEAEPCNIHAKNPLQKITTSKKDRIDGLRHSTNSKSPRGAALATLACDTPRKSRLRVQPD